MWPKAGYWVSDSTAVAAVQCGFPASSRCIGWDAAADTVVCGVGYDPTSPMCGSCLTGWYADAGGCYLCPTEQSNRFVRLMAVLVTAALIGALTFAAVATLQWLRQMKWSPSTALRRSVGAELLVVACVTPRGCAHRQLDLRAGMGCVTNKPLCERLQFVFVFPAV